MDEQRIQSLGDELYAALRNQTTLAPLTEREAEITIEDAYHISRQMVSRRVDSGERIVGKKIGVTSAPVQEMLGVFQPDFGFLTDAMEFSDGADISIAQHLIQPRAEGELREDWRRVGKSEGRLQPIPRLPCRHQETSGHGPLRCGYR